jgi:HAD superfamily hydrolase (TIGR01509 family)
MYRRWVFGVVVLDAMGVMYVDGDDVGQLLLPFIKEKGLDSPRSVVEPLYFRCSRGEFSTEELWRRLGADGDTATWDDEYVSRYSLSAGVHEFLNRMASKKTRIAALTNDTSSWSRRLRRRFQIDERINPWIVSGDVGHRKPNPEMYRSLLEAIPAVPPERMLFVDDRVANLDAAAQFGLKTVQFGGESGHDHEVVPDFAALTRFVDEH